MWRKIVTVLVVGLVLGGVVCGQEAEESAEKALVRKIAEDVRAQGPADEKEYLRMVVDAVKAELGPEHSLTLGVMASVAFKFYEAGAYAESREMFEEVLATRLRALGSKHPDTLAAMHGLAILLQAQGDFQGAREMLEEVLASLRRELGAAHPDTLKAMANLANTLYAQGDFQGAREMQEEVLAIRNRELGSVHPDTLKAKVNLAVTLKAQGDYQGAREMEEGVLAIRSLELGPVPPDTLMVMANLAVTLRAQGHFQDARKMQEVVLAGLRWELGATHPSTLTAMADLANTLYALGDLQDAREMEEEVLAIRRRVLGAAHPDTLAAMANLAVTLKAQGDIQDVREMEEEVLAIRRRVLGTTHPDTLVSMHNLASTLYAQEDFRGAREMAEEVLAIRRRVLGAAHPDTLAAIENLAVVMIAQGNTQSAQKMEEEVLAIRRRNLGATHPNTLKSMHNLAVTLKDLKNSGAARLLFEELLQIRQMIFGSDQSLGTEQEYKNLGALAEVYRALKEPAQAARRYLEALDALEAQIRRLAAAEDVRSQFKQKHEATYLEALKTLLLLERNEEAHHVLERFRAQGVLSLLAKRDIVLAKVPPDLEERRRDLDTQYDATVIVRDKLDPNKQQDAFAAVLKEQQEIRHERERLKAETRRRAPAVAEIEDPRPLTVEQIRPILEPGTLMLSYMVGPEKTYLFTLSRDDEIIVHEIDINEITLWKQVARFFGQLRQSTAPRTETSMAGMASWLYDKLFGDVSEQIAKSERVLVIPDGPLFYLPFGALVGPAGSYLAELKPVHSVVSATVYGHLLNRRPADANRPTRIAAFGDPLYPKGPVEKNATVRTAMERGAFDGGLLPLPSSEREVVEIGKLYPSARTFLGKDATEENVKALATGADVVHLAVHGVADPVTPLDSFVALSVTDEPGSENGLLQAWEIYERVRLDADLVVLSACETAFGPERDGEGLLSLSRAFQVAGARTVVASLWSVADESTAELMIRFYGHLKDGKPKDEALRAAQLEFLAGPVTFVDSKGKEVTRDFSSPYYWAAFQVIGDRK